MWRLFKPLFEPAVRHLTQQKARIAELLDVVRRLEAQINLHARNNQAANHDLATRLEALTNLHGHLAKELDVVTRQINDVAVRSNGLAERNDNLAAQLNGVSHQIHDLAVRWDAVTHRINHESDKSETKWADASTRLGSIEHLIKHIEATSVSRFDNLEADRNIVRQINGADAGQVGRRIRTIGKLLRPHTAVGRLKLRLGGRADGGYICLDDFGGVKTALSFGVDQDVSWDLAVAKRGLVVHQFDHTVEGSPTEHPNFRFNKIKICPVTQPGEESIGSVLASQGLNDPASVVLKIDIEGSEWDVFSAATASELLTFSQIICEFHGFQFVEDDQFYEKVINVLSKIASLFHVIHVHGNNYCPMFLLGGVAFPSLLEVTYVNVRRCEFVECKEIFPTPIDAPNNSTRPDFFLGNFIF